MGCAVLAQKFPCLVVRHKLTSSTLWLFAIQRQGPPQFAIKNSSTQFSRFLQSYPVVFTPLPKQPLQTASMEQMHWSPRKIQATAEENTQNTPFFNLLSYDKVTVGNCLQDHPLDQVLETDLSAERGRDSVFNIRRLLKEEIQLCYKSTIQWDLFSS